MGVHDVFQVLKRDAPTAVCGTVLTNEAADCRQLQGNVMDAHEALAALPGAAGQEFKAVVRCLAKDVEKK
jgi:hypothetical protein